MNRSILGKIEQQISDIVALHADPRAEPATQCSGDPQRILDRCIRRMERLSPHADGDASSLRAQLAYLSQKRRDAFDVFACPLFRGRLSCKKKTVVKSKDRTLSYEFRDKLTGFLSRRGAVLWSDEKLDEFIRSMMA